MCFVCFLPLLFIIIHIFIPGNNNNYYYYYTILYNEKYFSDDQFSYIIIVRVLTWRAQKMRSATSSEDSRLVRIVVPCAQISLLVNKNSPNHPSPRAESPQLQ